MEKELVKEMEELPKDGEGLGRKTLVAAKSKQTSVLPSQEQVAVKNPWVDSPGGPEVIGSRS